MDKIYPQGTADLYMHLGTHPSQKQNEPELSVPENVAVNSDKEKKSNDLNSSGNSLVSRDKATNTIVLNISKIPFKSLAKNIIPYIVVFVLAALFYFTFFGGLSLSEMKTWLPKENKPKEQKVVTQIPASQLDAYNKWINSYFFDVNDKKILDPNYDISGNGLTNYQKFLLGLNPKKKDTLGLGMTDTQALIKGIDPLTGGPLTDAQKTIIAKNIDLESISNMLTLESLDSAPKVAGISTASAASIPDLGRGEIIVNTNIPGELDIPRLNIKVPLIWGQDPASIDQDLENGVVHYPGTAMPGEIGTSYISGHSSNYVWAKGSYNRIFATIDKLQKYDSFSITATDASGKQVVFHYVVDGTGIFAADDQQQFANIGKSSVALSTCWPIGTAAKRYVVFGQLSQIDQ